MKLITAITALALLAGSMDVEAQKRGSAKNPPGGGKTPGTHQKAPEGAETGHPHISPVAHLAIGVFGALDPEERNDLAEAAGEGDEEALEELRAEHVEAIESMIEALEDEDARALIKLGMMLGFGDWCTLCDREAGDDEKNMDRSIPAPTKPSFMDMGGDMIQGDAADGMLDMVQQQLEAQLESWDERIGAEAQ